MAAFCDHDHVGACIFGDLLRISKRYVRVVIPGETGKKFLPSFSLQLLVENAIKHNELTQQSPLKVDVFCRDGRIIVSNNLQKKSVNESSANHGLANLAERYRLWSGDEIIIKEEAHMFSVSIKLLTNEYSDHRG